MNTCLNKSHTNFKKLADLYGENLASSFVRIYSKQNRALDNEFFYPTPKDFKNWLVREKKDLFKVMDYALTQNPNLSKQAILQLLKGVVNKYKDKLFVTKGWTNTGSLVITQEQLETVFKPNLRVVNALAAKYPSIFKVIDTKNENTKMVEISAPELLNSEAAGIFRDPKVREKYFKTGDRQKSSVVLTKIANSSHPLNEVAKKLLGFVRANDIEIVLEDTDNLPYYGGEITTSIGRYDSGNNKIYIAEKAPFKNGLVEKTLLHEILHALSYQEIRKNTKAAQDFDRLYKATIDQLGRYKPTTGEGYYATYTADEFFVALFTDSRFIKDLQNTPALDGIKYTNLFEEVMNYLLDLLGLKTNENLYAQAFSVATNMLESARVEEEYRFAMLQELEATREQEEYEELPEDFFASIPKTAPTKEAGPSTFYQLEETWDKYMGNVPDSESRDSVVKAGLKSVNALQTEKAVTLFSILDRNKVKGDAFWNKIQTDLQIPKEQIELLKQYNTTNREELVANMLGDYSYTIEINTAKNKIGSDIYGRGYEPKQITDRDFAQSLGAEVGDYFVEYITEDGDPDLRTFKTLEEANNAFQTQRSTDNSSVYSNLTVPGGTNYTENEISTPGVEVKEEPKGTDIKPGISELFDSNPELANQVYEALGFGKFRVTLGKELNPEQKFGSQGEPVVKKFEVLDENKDVIGTVTLDVAKDESITAHPTLTKIGKGYGQELYQIISLKFGAPVIEWGPHNISKSPEGKKLWNSLEKKGLAKAKYQWDDNVYLRGIDLSQQKQQAQQLYSQYLDSIFPESKVKDIVYHGTKVKFDKFDLSKSGQNLVSWGEIKKGINFTNNYKIAEYYSEAFSTGENSIELMQADFNDNPNRIKSDGKTINREEVEKEILKDNPDKIRRAFKTDNEGKFILDENGLKQWDEIRPYTDKEWNTIVDNSTKAYQEDLDILNSLGKNVIKAVVNIKNPNIVDYQGKPKDEKFFEILNKSKGDGFIAKNLDDWGIGDNIRVFEPEQIHILGSKQDVEGFKQWKKDNTKTVRKGAITPSIKGHAQFATDNGIGWFRSDDRRHTEEIEFEELENDEDETSAKFVKSYPEIDGPKTRRILEIQSDLFQKGRNKEELIKPYDKSEDWQSIYQKEKKDLMEARMNGYITGEEFKKELAKIEENANKEKGTKENQFLQLLNKDNNWVTFFVKSIVQDSAKKGYEKVLFPKGDTASKIEGHTTLEEFKKQKEDRIKELEKQLKNPEYIVDFVDTSGYSGQNIRFKTEQEALDYVKKENAKLPEDIEGGYESLFNGTRLKNEINQLKQELERVEREGFGALRPIYNFYENTVGNILKKQGYSPKVITDEYGNQWYEVAVAPETAQEKILFQREGAVLVSTASPELISKIKELLKKMGVDVKALNDYIKEAGLNIKGGVNGLADLTKGIVAIAEGKEDVALTEEMVHIATAIIEQKNPQLITEMISKIDRFKIYKEVYEQYKNVYKLPNGKPDIRKIKKEAVDKLITEIIVNKNDNTDQYPELREEDAQLTVRKWWNAILDWFRGMYRKSNISIFEEAAAMIAEGGIGTADTISSKDLYFQTIDRRKQTAIIDAIKKTPITKKDQVYSLNGVVLDTVARVSGLAEAFYKQIFGDKEVAQDEYRKLINDLKAETGDKIHYDFEAAGRYLLNPDGTLNPDRLDENTAEPDLHVPNTNPEVYQAIKTYLKGKMLRFPAHTKFLQETSVYDPNKKFAGKSGIAGTIDFLAITPDGKVGILDWKSMDLNVEKFSDVPWYKKKAWRIQVGEYKRILQTQYGIPAKDFIESSAIPIKVHYTQVLGTDNRYYPRPARVEIGDPNSSKEDRDYLIPVSLEVQSTGDKKIDSLLTKLIGIRQTFEDRPARTAEERLAKRDQINAIEKAFRHLQVKKSALPLLDQAELYINDLNELVAIFNATMKDADFSTFSNKTLSDFGVRLDRAFDHINVYASLDVQLKDLFKGELDEEQQAIYEDVKKVAAEAREKKEELLTVINEFGENIAVSEGYEGITDPEVQVALNKRLFNETSKIQMKTLQVFYQKRREAQNAMDFKSQEEGRELKKIQEKYKQLADKNNWTAKNYFDILVKKGTNQLIDEFKKEFYIKAKEAIQDKNIAWIKENVDIDAFKKGMKEEYERKKSYYETKAYAGRTEKEIEDKRNADLKKLVQEFDISTDLSDGWFAQYKLLYRYPIKSKWQSDAWKKLNAPENSAAKELYDWVIRVNEKADDAGYLPDGRDYSKRIFLPFVQKSVAEKLVFGGKFNLIDDILDAMTVDETTVGYGATDKVTGKLLKKIPKYFLNASDKESSTDLFKNLILYNASVNRYQVLSELEGIALALGRVEKNKAVIQSSAWGQAIFDKETGEPQTLEENTINASLYDSQIATLIYGQKYVNNEQFDFMLGKVDGVFKAANKIFGIKLFPENLTDRQLSMNKSIDALNNYFQLKALGLNPFSVLSTYLGGNFQSVINAGKMFTRTDFASAQATYQSLPIMGEEGQKIRAAMDYFLPFTSDFNSELAQDLSLQRLSPEKIQDFMYGGMRWADKSIQASIFIANLKNQVVINGEVVNARDYLRAQPEFVERYRLSVAERKQLEDGFEQKVKDLIDKNGVLKNAKVVDGQFVIDGVDRNSKGVYKVRNYTRELSKKAIGTMTPEEVRGVQQNIYLRSMMVFKNWIPSLVDVRLGEMKYNSALDAYEWGRLRTVWRFMLRNGILNLNKLHDAVVGNERGISMLNELYEYKKAAHFKATGQMLKMTEAEFYDLVRENIRQAAKDVVLSLTLMAMFLGAIALAPGDDEDKEIKNVHKFVVRAIDKVSDEVTFFYNPASFVKLFNGSMFPSLGVLSDITNILWHYSKEVWGIAIGDEESVEKNYTVKYLLKAFPLTSQISSYLPLFAPDVAKDLGIRFTSEARR